MQDAILARHGAERVLPFRYVAAARAAPRFEVALDRAMMDALAEANRPIEIFRDLHDARRWLDGLSGEPADAPTDKPKAKR